jgi:predicted nucleotidyltransferase
MTGLGHGAVQRELGNLADAGIITRSRQGRMVYYRANRDCPVFDELQKLMGKTAGLADVIRKAVASVAEQIDFAFVYGSQARFDAGVTSDVDMIIVGNVEDLALHRTIAEAEEHLDRSVNYTLLSRQEFEHRREDKEGFLGRVLRGEKIFIVGEAQDV